MITILNILILIFMPFVMIGIIKKTKAFWGGRKGVKLLQPLYDVLRLLKKETVYSETTSWVFKFAPVVGFSTILFAGLLVPMIEGSSIINIPFAFIIFVSVLYSCLSAEIVKTGFAVKVSVTIVSEFPSA